MITFSFSPLYPVGWFLTAFAWGFFSYENSIICDVQASIKNDENHSFFDDMYLEPINNTNINKS